MIKPFSKILLCLMLMVAVLFGVSRFMPLTTTGRLSAILTISIYAIIGAISYMACAFKLKIIDDVFGREKIHNIILKIKNKVVVK